MSEFGAVTAHVRHGRGKGAARTLRREGKIPAVMYGAGGDNLSLFVDPREFGKATDPDRQWNTLFHVTLKQDGKPDQVQPCLLADVHIDSVRRSIVHLDFMRVDPETEVVRTIPVEYVGRSVGVVKGGKLKTFRRSVKVGAKPGAIPIKLTVDISPIDSGESIRVKDLSFEGGRLVEHPEQRIAFVEIPKARQEDEAGEGEKEEEKK